MPSKCLLSLCFVTLLIAVLTSACTEELPPRPVVEVVVDTVSLQPYHRNTSYVGRLEALDDVRIQARVSGYLLARHFKEGDLIEKGALLYEIDPAQFKVGLARANADMAKAKAAMQVADRNFARAKDLAPKGAISAQELDKITATKLQADADFLSADAQIQSAEVELSYSRIRAPINGRIGRSAVSPGDLIGPETGELTSLVSIDPINAIFQVGEAVYLMAEARRRKLHEQGVDVPKLTVTLELSSREEYPELGYIDFIANRINEATGTIEARAVIPNSLGVLRPGQYVKVKLEAPDNVPTLMLPQAAVQADQQGSFVLVVGSDNKVQRQNVQLDNRVNDLVVITGGAKEGQQVIVRGLQKVRPGLTVKTQHIEKKAAHEPPSTLTTPES